MWLGGRHKWFEWLSQGIDAFAVMVGGSIIFGALRFVLQSWKRTSDPYRGYKVLLGRSLLLSLEVMVAAQVIRTVLLDLTARGLEILAGLVII